MRTSLELLPEMAPARQIARRQVLQRASALAGAVAVMLLEACGSSGSVAPTATKGTTSNAAVTPNANTSAPTVIRSAGSAAAPATSGSGTTPVANAPAAGKPASKNQTLIFPYPNEFRTLDPSGATEAGSVDLTHTCYEGLVAPVPRSADIQPRLAASWDIAPGAQQITFKLQQGVKFHDGTMMDATAVKKTFERVAKMNLGNAAAIADIDTIDVVDQFTVRFNLKSPNAYFVENTTQIGIISPTAIEKNDKGGDYGAAWLEAGHTAGTGPWMLTEFKKNETKTASKFADYWRGWSKPHIEKIVWPIVPEATTRRQMLEKGDAHIVSSLPLVDAKALESNPAAQILYTRAFLSWTMPMVMSKPPLDNLKVRQAMQYAFDYQTYLDQVWLGHGTIANGPTAPGLAGFTSDSPPFKQDLEKARQLIAESGLSNITITQLYIDTSAEEKQSAVLLQDALKKIGVNLQLTAAPWATLFKQVSSQDTAPHMTNLQIGPTRPDPAFTMEWAYGSKYVAKPYNWSYFSNPQVDDLIAKARASSDRNQGKTYLEQANKLIIAAAPTIWYSQPDRYDTISAKVQNLAQINIGYPHEIDYFEMYLSD